jgi:hypothetical protein
VRGHTQHLTIARQIGARPSPAPRSRKGDYMQESGAIDIEGTLFHFTDNFAKLVGILESDFKPHYCLEDLRLATFGGGTDEDRWAVPMTCFCDLRLSQIREHLDDYGGYGIGLTKTWGAANGLSPLIYLYPESYSSELFGRAIEHLRILKDLEDSRGRSNSTALITALELVAITKPYEGISNRKGTPQRKRFYDEREWRYLPHMTRLDGSPDHLRVLSAQEFHNEDLRDKENDAIATLCPLQFSPWDIVYLFVKEDSEVLPLVEEIRRIKSRYAEQEVQLLTTRIMTTDRIPRDF